jgi:hypothetical protein
MQPLPSGRQLSSGETGVKAAQPKHTGMLPKDADHLLAASKQENQVGHIDDSVDLGCLFTSQL